METKRAPVGYVVATVKFPLYEGDSYAESEFPWFEYSEPGITSRGELGVCVRKCETLSAKIEMIEDKETA